MLDFGYYNMDCMQGMKEFPDKYFELAIVDPPYGINIETSGTYFKKFKTKGWDNETPKQPYFDELMRVSKNQIIWGANYFQLPPNKCFIIWKKPQISEELSFSMCEYAWASFDSTAKVIEIYGQEFDRIHPTQKPIKLYEWLLAKYAKQGDKILDTHVGSASSLIACHNLGFQYVGFEIDKDYYDQSLERLNRYKSQVSLMDIVPKEDNKQIGMEV